jgi:hypothetical protein
MNSPLFNYILPGIVFLGLMYLIVFSVVGAYHGNF